MNKKQRKAERVVHANQLIKAISEHGRRFFYSQTFNRIAHMHVDDLGKIWFVDDYTDKPIYTHYQWDWKGFSHGGTLRNLVCMMRDYISTGKQIDIWCIAPNRGLMDGHHDMWGYGKEACEALKAAVAEFPIIKAEAGKQEAK